MIRNFLTPYTDKYEAKEIDMETGRVKLYFLNKGSENCGIDFPFGEYDTSISEMGYNSPKEFISGLKRRGILGEEVDHESQIKKEAEAYLKLAKFRTENGWKLLSIPEKLEKYYNVSAAQITEYIEK